MAELPDSIYAEVERLSSEGNEFADADEFQQALSRFQAAWQLLPEPRTSWSAGLWLLVSVGDMWFQLRRFPEGREALMTAMKYYSEAPGNPFIRLRLGQCMFELGENHEAANWLAGAFINEGMKLFGSEDPKYVLFIKSQLQAPPGGWPKGW
ncbi:MAG: tetratricopeptide repeat protein [Pirellulaceae bacterium]